MLECAKYAQGYGVYLALEQEENNIVRTSQDVHKMIKEVNHKNLRALLEVGHANMIATDDVLCGIDILKEFIVHCHVHDNRGTNDEHGVPGEGTVCWLEVLKKLKQISYEGALVFELLVDNPDQGASKGKAYLEAIMERLTS